MVSILMKHEATSSQADEVTQLAQFPWRFLPSMLSKLLHYMHFVLSVRKITFTPLSILRVSFLVHVFSHESHSNVVSSTSLWFILKYASRVPFFVTYILTPVTYFLYLVLCQSLLYGYCVYILEYLNSHSSHWNCWSFSSFWLAFMTSEHMYLQIYLFSIFVFTLGTLMWVIILNLILHMVLPQGTNR